MIAVGTVPFVVRHLGATRFGILSLAWVFVGFFYVVDLGLGRAATKFAAELLGRGENTRLPALFWTSLSCQAALGTVGGIALGLLTPWLVGHVFRIPSELAPEARSVFFVLTVSVPLVPLTLSLMGMLCAGQRFDLLNAIAVPSSSVLFLLPAVGVALGFGLASIVALLVIWRLATAVGYLAACFRAFPILRQKLILDRGLLGPLLGFGGWVTVSGLVAPALLQLDRLLIGAIVSVAAVTYYSVPYEALARLFIIPGSLIGVLFPAFSSLDGSGARDRIPDILVRSLKYLLLTLSPVFALLILFAGDILRLWLGADFAAKATQVFQVLALGLFFACVAWVPYTVIQSVGRPDITAKFQLLELPAYVCLAWFLTKQFGIVGAACAWASRAALELVFFFRVCSTMKLVPERFLARKHLGRTLALVVQLGLGLGLVGLAGGGVLTRIVLAAAMLTAFLCAAWAYAFEPPEKRFFASLADQPRSYFNW
jgi:O-antigen/teichoic acid export membrane protein